MIMVEIASQSSNVCNRIAGVFSDASVVYSPVSKPLSNWLCAISLSLKMASPALKTYSVRSIFKTPEGKSTITPVYKATAAFAELISTSIPGIDFAKIFEKLQPTVTILFGITINRGNPFKTPSGETVIAPICGALSTLAELAPICLVGVNFSKFFRNLKTTAAIFDAAKNFSKVLGTGSTSDRAISALQCVSVCFLLLGKSLLIVGKVWLAATGLGILNTEIYRGIAILVLDKTIEAFFKFDEKYNIMLGATEEIFSITKLPEKLVDPLLNRLSFEPIYK
ncbi:MAG: hypothetical protein LBB15_00925 [Puniceicoccales bacterium]|jgi:hypothetical protein|nr:hypothetical protein [Puniceicoccales bacterium]